MSLEDLGNIGEFVGAIAVVFSLIYLAFNIRQNTRQLSQRQVGVDHTPLLLGALTLEIEGRERKRYNSAIILDAERRLMGRYDKKVLVPFGEYVPRWARFAFTDSLVREVGAFTPGENPLVLPARVPIGVAICFEVVFPDLAAAEVRAGSEIMTTLTNDGWYGLSWAPKQHFAQGRLRAAETQRWFVRAALTGISGFIDPFGQVEASLGVGETGLLTEVVQPMRGLGPRARWGDWWAMLCRTALRT